MYKFFFFLHTDSFSLSVSLFLTDTTVMSEPDVEPDQRFQVFIQIYGFGYDERSSGTMFYLIFGPIMLLVFMAIMAIPSIKYKRLALLVATLRLPKHHLDDFIILQKQNAAVTIYDIPINVEMLIMVVRFAMLQVFVVGISLAGGSS